MELLRRVNEVCTRAAATTISAAKSAVVRMMQPSAKSMSMSGSQSEISGYGSYFSVIKTAPEKSPIDANVTCGRLT